MLPEEVEFERLTVEQEKLEEDLITEELKLETVKGDCSKMRYRYYQSAGVLYAELDDLEALIAAVEADQDPQNETSQEEAKEAKKKAKKSAEEAGVIEKEPAPPVKISSETKLAFRKAAMLMHPDRGTTEAERQRRHNMMAKLNMAYAKGDKEEIDKLIVEFGADPEAISGDDTGALIIKAFRRIAQMRVRLEAINKELNELESTEMHELHVTITEAEKMGGTPLDDLVAQITHEISERKIFLEMLRIKKNE